MEVTLLIMAAGLGSRYGGGIKQLEPVGLNDEIIMDYSIHDAIEAGFNKIIFVIRKDIEADFKERIGDRVETVCAAKGVKVVYTFQDINDIPAEVPEGRTKPWGTGHAVLSAKEFIDGPFAVINADDYYGKTAFVQMFDWLSEPHEGNAISMAGFILKNTLSDNGAVTRGICAVEQGHTHATDVIETRNIVKTPNGAEANGVPLDPDYYVSMNFWGFPGQPPRYMKMLWDGFVNFFEIEVPANPMKSEYLLPVHIGGLLRKNKVSLKVLETPDTWFGVTYAEDKDYVKESFKALIDAGVYKEDLYSDL